MTASIATNPARLRIAGRPTVAPSPPSRGSRLRRFQAASARTGRSSAILSSTRRPYGVPTSPGTPPTSFHEFHTPVPTMTAITMSAQAEKRYVASTAYGLASAPSSLDADLRRKASAGKAPSQAPVATMCAAFTRAGRALPGSTPTACPAQATRPAPRTARRPPSIRQASQSACVASLSRRSTSAARRRTMAWWTSQTVP